MKSNADLPLAGIEAVTIEQAVAAPFATARLADAGARVVKVERPGGDLARGYDAAAAGQSSYFVWLNRGKVSAELDLATAEGQAALAGMLETADVLVQNLKPGALARMGFDKTLLAHRYPRLITCNISGYGETGPMTDRKAYDLLVQAESGLCSITGGPSEPARVGISVVDIATGATAYAAILEALIKRGQTGRGAHISISMFDVMAEWLTVPLLNHEAGQTPGRIGLAHPSIAPYGAFPTQDGGEILISIQTDREWTRFCAEVLAEPSLGSDPRFATNIARIANRREMDARIARSFAAHSQAELADILQKSGIAFAAVNDMEGLSRHPHLRRMTIDTPNGPVSLPAPAPIVEGEDRRYGPVPALGSKDTET